jgi:hypothetical protein
LPLSWRLTRTSGTGDRSRATRTTSACREVITAADRPDRARPGELATWPRSLRGLGDERLAISRIGEERLEFADFPSIERVARIAPVCRDSEVIREAAPHDWKSWCPRFESGSRHHEMPANSGFAKDRARRQVDPDITGQKLHARFTQRVNVRGELIPVAPAGSAISDAAWVLENLSRAKQTLPNGYCGLPLQQTCPHPNACLTRDAGSSRGVAHACGEERVRVRTSNKTRFRFGCGCPRQRRRRRPPPVHGTRPDLGLLGRRRASTTAPRDR